MRKKLVSALVCAGLVVSLSANAFAAEDARAGYMAAIQKTNSVTSQDMSMMMTASMTSAGETETIRMQVMSKMVQGSTPNDIQMQTDLYMADANTVGVGEKFQSIYYKDGYSYVDMPSLNVKAKSPLALGDAQTTAANALTGMDVTNLYSSITSVKQGTDTLYTVTIDPAKMDEIYKGVFSSLGSLKGMESLKSTTVKVNSIKFTSLVNAEGYLSNMNMKMDIDMNVEGETAKLVCDMNMVNYNPGQPVSISFPADLTDYPLVGTSAAAPTGAAA